MVEGRIPRPFKRGSVNVQLYRGEQQQTVKVILGELQDIVCRKPRNRPDSSASYGAFISHKSILLAEGAYE